MKIVEMVLLKKPKLDVEDFEDEENTKSKLCLIKADCFLTKKAHILCENRVCVLIVLI